MDELLMDRMKQLKLIEDRLDRAIATGNESKVFAAAIDLHVEVKLMIAAAEAEYAAFLTIMENCP